MFVYMLCSVFFFSFFNHHYNVLTLCLPECLLIFQSIIVCLVQAKKTNPFHSERYYVTEERLIQLQNLFSNQFYLLKKPNMKLLLH